LSARCGFRSVALSDGAVLVMGGLGESNVPMNDVWRTEDGGYKWIVVTSTAAWRGNGDMALKHLTITSIPCLLLVLCLVVK
jgi:hypothetical protein